MECLRTCPSDNIAINLRPFGTDLERPSARMDEAFKAFIMLGSAMIYTGVLLGPWGMLKDAAYGIGSKPWLLYSAAFAAAIFLILPGLFLLALKSSAAIKRSRIPLRTTFAEAASALIPLGLMFWAAFSLSFVLSNASYILMSISDPFGWGWDLFRTASSAWQPVLTWMVTPLQTLALAGGLLWSANLAAKISTKRGLSPLPLIAFMLLVSTSMAWLLL
jgi:hypothetical protein